MSNIEFYIGKCVVFGLQPAAFITILALGFCPVSFSQENSQAALQQIKAADSGILGGNGLSIETAIVLTSQDNFELIRQEREIFRAVYGFSPENQSLIKKNGRYYDVWRGNGKALYFDITAYWQHQYGAQPSAPYSISKKKTKGSRGINQQ